VKGVTVGRVLALFLLIAVVAIWASVSFAMEQPRTVHFHPFVPSDYSGEQAPAP